LEQVWGPQGRGFAFTPYKDPSGNWHETSLEYPRDGFIIPKEGDVYFCPNLFASGSRRIGEVKNSCWLYADLDEVDPREITPKPTIAWESSADRYQALWRLSKKVKPAVLNELNKRLTYLVGADKSGWDLTQVLRVPGTHNHKYEEPQPVELMWTDGPEYTVTQIRKMVKEVDPGDYEVEVEALNLPDLTPAEIFSKHRKSIDSRAKRMLRAKHAVEGERSDRLWELENLLLDAGVSPEETFVLVKNSVWNKYEGRADEEYRLWLEIQKAARTQQVLEVAEGESTPYDVAPTGWEHHDLFMQSELRPPAWMVEGIWSDRSHGIIAGEPKGYKSVISTDLAVSVASGTKFLGHYDTPVSGPVLMIQEENAPWLMQSRLRKIEKAHGVLGEAHITGEDLVIKKGKDLPIEMLNQQGFDLTDPTHLQSLERKVQVVRPVLVILDPLYMMIGDADENSARDMRPILQWLLQLKVRYATGIVLVHHYSKQGQTPRRGGQRMRGSGSLHGWVESALYVEKDDNNPHHVTISREHRGQEPQGIFELEVFEGIPDDDDDYEVIVHDSNKIHKDKGPLWRYVKKHKEVRIRRIAEAKGWRFEKVKRLAEKEGLEIRKKESRNSKPVDVLVVPGR
jgi:RecA-family ATPase